MDLELKAKERNVEKLTSEKGNNVFKFKKSNIAIGDGVLKCDGTYGLFQFWPFKHGKKSIDIQLSDIQFVDVFPYGFFFNGVDITCGNDEELILVSCPKNALMKLQEKLSEVGVKSQETEIINLKQGFRTRKILRMEGDYLVFKKYKNRGRMIDYSRPEKVIYFDKGNSILGGSSVDFGSLAGGGSDNSIFIDKITSGQVKEIRELLIRHGSKLADMDNAKKYTSVFPLRQPKRWLSGREVLGFTADGILHIQRTLGKSRSSYLPFDTIKVISSEGFMSKTILIQGATTISSVEKFSSSVWKKVKNIVKEHDVKLDNVITFRPVFYLFSKETRGIKLSLSEDGVIYTNKKKEMKFLRYDQINYYKRNKTHWYNWFGVVCVRGIRHDARVGEGGAVEMILPKIGPCRWRTIKSEIAKKSNE